MGMKLSWVTLNLLHMYTISRSAGSDTCSYTSYKKHDFDSVRIMGDDLFAVWDS
jgi:hypothetical protein